jgi:hypothetical protein
MKENVIGGKINTHKRGKKCIHNFDRSTLYIRVMGGVEVTNKRIFKK